MRIGGGLWDKLRPKKVFYGWYIVWAGAATNVLLTGFVGFGFGVFITRFREEFGWSLTAIALGFSIRSFESGLLSPFTGFLQDKLGPRSMGMLGMGLLVLAYLIYASVQNLWVYYAGAAVMALGQSLGGYNAFTVATMRWFNRRRGKAVGIMNVGHGASYFGPLALTAVIAAFGWREALLGLALALLLIGLPLTMVIRERPEAYGLLPDGEAALDGDGVPARAGGHGARSRRSDAGFEVREVLRMPAFFLLVLTTTVYGFGHNAWNAYQIPHLESAGFSLTGASLLLGGYGALQIPLRLGLGWLGDKYGRQRVYKYSYLCHGPGMVLFALLGPGHLWSVPLYYIIFGIGHAAMHAGGTTMMADYFGAKRYGTLRGLNQSLHLPASILSPLFGGWMFDRYGDYTLAFIVFGAISASGFLWLTMVRRPVWDDLPQTGQPEGAGTQGASTQARNA